tara:strand:+ start:501 stop:632 length:132 start_codon:yes stop_codon:yes gene_type:complete
MGTGTITAGSALTEGVQAMSKLKKVTKEANVRVERNMWMTPLE